MTTFIIFALIVLLIIVSLAQGKRISILQHRLTTLKDGHNTGAKRGNEHFRAFKELASHMGFELTEEKTLENPFEVLFGGEPERFGKKLVLRKKEPVKKIRVRKVADKPARRRK